MAVGYGLVAAFILCGGIGYLLDQMLDTSPSLALSGLVLGLMVGFYALYKFMSRT